MAFSSPETMCLFVHVLPLLTLYFLVSGHLMSTAEVEAALTEHSAVAEAAVVSRPHKVKGECLYCFVTLKNSREFNHTLVEDLKGLGEALTQGIYWRGEGKSTESDVHFGLESFFGFISE